MGLVDLVNMRGALDNPMEGRYIGIIFLSIEILNTVDILPVLGQPDSMHLSNLFNTLWLPR